MMLLANLAQCHCQPAPLSLSRSRSMSSPGDGRSHTVRRVVLFPFPSVSHTAAMLQLAALLRARGLAVTVLHADLNAPDPARRHRDLAFVSIHESPLPDDVAACPYATVRQAMALNDACEAPFQAALAAELARGATGGGEVACAVVDAHLYRMLGAATRAGVPALAFRADGAAAFLAELATPRDLIGAGGSDGDEETALRFAAAVADAARASASAVVLDTFDAIEAAELAKIRRELSGRPAFAVGPLHLLARPPPQPAATAEEDRAPGGGGVCLVWLDARPPRSVLYVNLGSAATIDRAAFVEMAWGLAGSGVPFLWVLPRGSILGGGGGAGDDGALPPFPEELEDTARRRGKVVAWSPQREVLAHPSVGGFWTSCGWSSTMEAVCAGVPMLVHPCFGGGGQAVAARYVTRRWGTGMEIGRVLERTAVARTIRRLMARELGPHAPRERARFLKLQARQCVAEAGPANLAIDDLVEYMLGL